MLLLFVFVGDNVRRCCWLCLWLCVVVAVCVCSCLWVMLMLFMVDAGVVVV